MGIHLKRVRRANSFPPLPQMRLVVELLDVAQNYPLPQLRPVEVRRVFAHTSGLPGVRVGRYAGESASVCKRYQKASSCPPSL